jgi:hypothetical protein
MKFADSFLFENEKKVSDGFQDYFKLVYKIID